MAQLLTLGVDARAVFETTVNRLGQKPETVAKAKLLYAFFHEYESQYGELSQMSRLERRMADLFPEDPKLSQFARRFTSNGFDPIAVRPIISPATQTRPKILPSIEEPATTVYSPPRRVVPENVYSPKRNYPGDESDPELNRVRKQVRADSPLKGAAGRRLDQQKRTQKMGQGHTAQGQTSAYGRAPSPLPRDVMFLLSIIPRAETYYPAPRFNPEEMVRLIRETNLPSQLPSQGLGPGE